MIGSDYRMYHNIKVGDIIQWKYKSYNFDETYIELTGIVYKKSDGDAYVYVQNYGGDTRIWNHECDYVSTSKFRRKNKNEFVNTFDDEWWNVAKDFVDKFGFFKI